MRAFACVLAAVLLGASSPLAGQMMVRKEKPLDPARAKVRDALVVLRDSLLGVDAAASRLTRDLRRASDAAAVARARAVRDACDRSLRVLPEARSVVTAATWEEERRMREQAEFVRSLADLERTLAGCTTEFGAMSGPGQGAQARDYGPSRMLKIQAGLRRYDRAVQEYLGVLQIRVRPAGAGPDPLAG